MKIQRLYINNFKSLVNLELIEPNPFSVFVGPNGSGKSNIFEALEFANFVYKDYPSLRDIFDLKSIFNFNPSEKTISFQCSFTDPLELSFKYYDSGTIFAAKNPNYNSLPNVGKERKDFPSDLTEQGVEHKGELIQLIENFNRIFIRNRDLVKRVISSDTRLSLDASNLEKVLGRILKDEKIREEIIESLQILIPEFDNIEIRESSLSGEPELAVYEKTIKQPLPKHLISDGTYNILSLLTAVYQTNQPQFLLIEEPENGLNPYVIRQLVSFFRKQCEEKGHYIWLNTHSQTLVKELRPQELILVDKVEGETKIKQLPPDYSLYNLELDEAWLSNALGGGVPW